MGDFWPARQAAPSRGCSDLWGTGRPRSPTVLEASDLYPSCSGYSVVPGTWSACQARPEQPLQSMIWGPHQAVLRASFWLPTGLGGLLGTEQVQPDLLNSLPKGNHPMCSQMSCQGRARRCHLANSPCVSVVMSGESRPHPASELAHRMTLPFSTLKPSASVLRARLGWGWASRGTLLETYQNTVPSLGQSHQGAPWASHPPLFPPAQPRVNPAPPPYPPSLHPAEHECLFSAENPASLIPGEADGGD